MADSVKYTGIEVMLHGSEVGGYSNSGSWPRIWIKFDIEFSRNNPADPNAITFTMSNAQIIVGQKSGTYGYQIYAYIGFDSPTSPTLDDIWLIAEKTTNDGSNWWNKIYAYNRSSTFTASSPDSITMRFYVKNRNNCQHGSYVWCFNSSGTYCWIKDVTKSIPFATYTISYNANGGTGAPDPQIKNQGVPLTLSSVIPTYPIDITYHNNPDTTVSVNRAFDYWREEWTGNTYQPGGEFTKDANTVLIAEWGSASYVPIAVPDAYFIVTYEPNGGTVIPPTDNVLRDDLGYNTDPTATTATHIPGTTYTTKRAVDLYPIYGNATLLASDMPTPTRIGYVFEGWYRDSALTDLITDANPLIMSSNAIVYAKWQAFPIHQVSNTDWGNIGPYAWECVDGAWWPIAHTYKCMNVNGTKQWVDLVPAPQPADVFNHGTCAGQGLHPYFADGVVHVDGNPNYPWVVTDTTITKNYWYASIITLGGICDRGHFNYLCVDCSVGSPGTGWAAESRSAVGLRWLYHGKGTSAVSEGDKFIRFIKGYPEYDNYDHQEPWWKLSRQVVKLDLHTFNAQPFYITFSAVDAETTIYGIWFE